MCLRLQRGHSPYIPYQNTIAWIAWKVVCETEKNVFVSPLRKYKYHAGVLQPKVRLSKRTVLKRQGYHAFVSHAHAVDYCYLEGEVVVPVLIPAGSQVFYGISNDLVANQLILFRDTRQLNRYLKNGGQL